VWTRNKTRNTIVTYAFRLRTHHVHSSINSLMPGGHISGTLSVWTSLFRRSLLLPVHSLLSGLVKSKNTMLLGIIKGFLFPILWDRWTGEHAQESQFFYLFWVKFVKQPKWQWSIGEFSQIWLKPKHESKKI
jgi:hypothetical protein